MSAVAAPEHRRDLLADAASTERRLFEPAGGATLEARVLRLWDELARDGVAACPVCGGELRVSGCDGCGSTLT